MTGRSFFSRIRDLVRYRAATKNMDQRYPNATPEELGRTDGTCIICREEMVIHGANPTAPNVNPQANSSTQPQPQPQANARPTTASPPSSGLNETPKKLPCGHIFHFYCLRSWLERQQSCPTCRRTVLDANGQPVNQPPTAVPGAAGARPAGAPAATATRTQAAPAGNAGTNPTASATQRVGQFARQLETQAQRQRELELEGRGGASQTGTSAAVPNPNPSLTPTPTANPNPNPNAPRTSTSASRPAGTATSSVPRTTAQRSTTTAAGTTSSLISAVFADPVSTASSSSRYPSSVAASIASGSRPAQWGSAYGTQNLGQMVPSAPPGYGYHQSYPNRQSQVQHGLPLPTGGFGSSSWTPPRPSSLASPQVQSNAIPTQASASSSTARGSSPASQAPAAASTTNSQAPITPSSNGTTATPATSTTVPAPAVEEAAQEEPLDPKEAARAAALKRFAASSKVASKSASKLTAAVKGQTSSTKPTSEPTPPSSKVEEKVETDTTSAASGSSSSSTAPGNPQLIPLFDPSIVPDYQSLHESRLPYPLVSPQVPISTTPRNGFDLSSFSLRSHPANSPSIPSVGNDLPTKESLEESLKALVAVQENVWKAIEEVTRVVSSLPSTSQVQVGSAPVVDRSEPATTGSDRDSPKSTSSDWKGKQAAEGINAPSASSSSRSASPPPPSTRSISPTLTPPTRTQNPWSNESALSSGNSTPAIEHSQSALFSSNPMPRSLSPSRQNLSSTSGVVVDELDMTDEQRNQEVNNMLASHKPKRRVSFASRDDTIEPEEKETSEESQQEDVETETPLGRPGADEEEIGNDSSNSVQAEVNGVEDLSLPTVNGIGPHDESDDGDEEVVAQDSTPLVNGAVEQDVVRGDEEEGEVQEEAREEPILDR